jgi:hypothetical protein
VAPSPKGWTCSIAARLAGHLDWNYIRDRTRNLVQNSHWADPEGIIDSAARSYAIDKWQGQEWRPEVWVEKEALVGVIENVCRANDVAFFACRGYTSQSEVWAASRRMVQYRKAGQKPIIFHLGDHDPSGVDMTRDVTDRLTLFMGGVPVERLALNMDQIRRYNPPPNPAKLTDSRVRGYLDTYGDESWELDALEPTVIVSLLETAIRGHRDPALWNDMLEREKEERRALTAASAHWEDVVSYMRDDLRAMEFEDGSEDSD